MNITAEMKMADVVHQNYSLLPVITRFGIDLGFGESTVAEVCSKSGVNLDFFLEITNSFIDEDYVPQVDLGSFPVSLIVDYLEKTHAYYMNDKIPGLEAMIRNLVSEEDVEPENARLVLNFFREYVVELDNHIAKEEKKIQPYVLRVEKAWLEGKLDAELEKRIREYSINDFAREHDNIEEKLNDLKNIIIKYLPPFKNKSLCNAILMELFRLEKDLNAHAELEDKVLIPKVAGMESKLMEG